jgi:polysaccharide export outer membrane protein
MASLLHILLVLGTLCGVASAQGAEQGVYRIGPGDVLDILVHDETFGGEYTVGPDGTTSFPYLDRVHMAGLTLHEAEDELEAALRDGVLNFPQVSITVADYASQPVEVLGAVRKPGTYHLDGPTYLRSIIARAGGIATEKSSRRVRITHKNGDEVLVGLAELSGEAGALQLVAGDVVTVDEGVFIFISGEVKNPGAVSWNDGMSVTEALTLAGGETGIARLRGAYVLRDDEKIRVNIRRIRNNKTANLTLQPGDQLVVPESPL